MTTKCHLILLSGQGDTHTILINDDAIDYLDNAHDGRPIPDELIADYVAHQREVEAKYRSNGTAPTDAELIAQAQQALAYSDQSGSAYNDIAMSMGGSSFGGERWNNYGSPEVKRMMEFIAKHNLDLDSEFVGSIY